MPNAARMLFVTPVEVRWRDLDAFAHVNNAAYLTYLEQARLHWLRQHPEILDEAGRPVLAACQLNYRAPIHWPAEIEVRLFAQRLGRRSFTLGHHIVDRHDGRLYCDGKVTLVWTESQSGRAIDLPAALRRAVAAS